MVRVTIILEGETEADIDTAAEEAVSEVKQGFEDRERRTGDRFFHFKSEGEYKQS